MNKSQSAGIWIVVILLVLCLVSMLFTTPANTIKELSYSQFISMVEDNKINSVTIDNDTIVAQAKDESDKTQYKVLVPKGDNSFYSTLKSHEVDMKVQKPSESSQMLGILGSTLLPLIFFVVFIIFMAKMLQSGGSQAMSFGKSKAKLMLENKVKVTFNDVAGIDEEKQ